MNIQNIYKHNGQITSQLTNHRCMIEQFTCIVKVNNFADNLLNKQLDVVYKYLFAHRSSVNQWLDWVVAFR